MSSDMLRSSPCEHLLYQTVSLILLLFAGHCTKDIFIAENRRKLTWTSSQVRTTMCKMTLHEFPKVDGKKLLLLLLTDIQETAMKVFFKCSERLLWSSFWRPCCSNIMTWPHQQTDARRTTSQLVTWDRRRRNLAASLKLWYCKYHVSAAKIIQVISAFPSKCCLWNVSLLGNVFIFLQQKQASVFWVSRRRRLSLVSLPVTEGRRWKSSQLHVDLDMWERRRVVTASQVHWVHFSCAPLAHVTVHTLICFWELLSQKLLSHWLCRINILEKKTVYSW